MPKAFCIAGAVVAILLLLVFGIDLILGIPLRRPETGLSTSA